MPLVIPYITSLKENHEDALWVREECYRFYVRQRRQNCSFMEIMDLWLRAPCCDECINSELFEDTRPPDIMTNAWEVDIALNVSPAVLEECNKELQTDPNYAFLCKRCGKELRPWDTDNIYVVSYHLEEHYGIPLETQSKREPSQTLQKQIKKLYDYKCFSCNSSGLTLTIDHINPQCNGGDAAFRNLQPLCEKCNNTKGDQEADEVTVFSDIYFGPYPSDGYEGLFW